MKPIGFPHYTDQTFKTAFKVGDLINVAQSRNSKVDPARITAIGEHAFLYKRLKPPRDEYCWSECLSIMSRIVGWELIKDAAGSVEE